MGIVLKDAVMEGEEVLKEAIVLRYGMLINALITFLLTAFALFLVETLQSHLLAGSRR